MTEPPPDEPPHAAAPADPADAGEVHAAVLAANDRFYEAFEARDLDAMSDLWERSERASCTHPGWSTLHGWAKVSSSWMALFTRGDPLQFIVTGARAVVEGSAGWVTCEENILSPSGNSSTTAAVNVFALRADGSWRMVAHHAGPIAGP